jgi:amino acid transporter
MIILGLAAVLVLVIFQAKLTTLIQLYIIGVFVSFSLGQLGMVKHWRRELRLLSRRRRRHGERRSRACSSMRSGRRSRSSSS